MSEFKVGDWVVFMDNKSFLKKIIRVDKVCNINIETYNHYDDGRHFKELVISNKFIRHATEKEIKAGRIL